MGSTENRRLRFERTEKNQRDASARCYNDKGE